MRPTDSPTTLIDCTHQADHYHGTLVAYKMDGCRCADCKGAQRRYGQWYRGHRPPRSRAATGADWYPGSPAWLRDMRAGLWDAYRQSLTNS